MQMNEKKLEKIAKGLLELSLAKLVELPFIDDADPDKMMGSLVQQSNDFLSKFDLSDVLVPYKGNYPKLAHVGNGDVALECGDKRILAEDLTFQEIFEKWNSLVESLQKVRGFELVKDAPADTILPRRSTKGSAGYDFYAPYDIILTPHSCSKLVFLNVKAYMQPDEKLQMYIRSSLAVKSNITLETSGLIDSDYYSNPDNDGNIGVKFRNNGDAPIIITKGTRCCQGVFGKYLVADGDDVNETRTGGYGSTGV